MADIDAPPSSAFRDAQTREKQYAADLKYFELQQRLGEVVPIAEVKVGARNMAEAALKVITHLPSHADALAAAFTKAGIPQMRSELNAIVHNMRVEIADAFGVIAESAEPWIVDPVHGIQPAQPRKEEIDCDQTADHRNSGAEQRPHD
jgi:hypothetical protein